MQEDAALTSFKRGSSAPRSTRRTPSSASGRRQQRHQLGDKEFDQTTIKALKAKLNRARKDIELEEGAGTKAKNAAVEADKKLYDAKIQLLRERDDEYELVMRYVEAKLTMETLRDAKMSQQMKLSAARAEFQQCQQEGHSLKTSEMNLEAVLQQKRNEVRLLSSQCLDLKEKIINDAKLLECVSHDAMAKLCVLEKEKQKLHEGADQLRTVCSAVEDVLSNFKL